MENRYYQNEQLAAIESNYTKGIHQQVISAATGTGKTVVFAQIPERMKKHLPGQTLVLAHREELLDQSINKLRDANPSLKTSKEKAEHMADAESDIIVASVATLGRRGTQRIERFNWEQIDKIITDECHHSTAQSYLNIYEKAKVLPDIPTNKLHVGFSATTQRADGRGLSKVFKSIVHEYSLRKAIEDQFLTDVKGIRITTGTNLEQVRTTAGDFDQGDLAEAVNTNARNSLIAKSILEHAKDRQTIVFCVDIEHSKNMAELLQHCGLKAEALWGTDNDRADKLNRFADGITNIICNCNVLTEGYDNPSVSCIVLARPTKSSVLYVQMIGRGTRLFPGKVDCLVLDLVDISGRHSLITLPTLMGMSAALNLRGGSLVRAIQLIEEKQAQYGHIDFSRIDDVTKLDAFIESVDLFNVKPIPEVQENSELIWHSAIDGGYILQLPNKDKVRVYQNLLDKWELKGDIGGKKYKGERETIAEIFSAADNLVYQQAPHVLKLVKSGQKWHDAPATLPQLSLLRKLFKNKPLPEKLTKGVAAQIIGRELAKKG